MDNKLIQQLMDLLNRQTSFDAELYVASGKTQEITLNNGKLEQMEQSFSAGMGLRIFKDDKTAFTYANQLDIKSLEELIKTAKELLAFAEPDPCVRLPVWEANSLKEDLQIKDASLFDISAAGRIELVRDYADKVYSLDKRIKSILRAGYSQSEVEVRILNTKSGMRDEQSSSCGFGMSCIAEQNGETQVGSSHTGKRYFEEIDFKASVEEAAFMAGVLLGGKKVPSGSMSIVMHPEISCEFLDLVESALSADNYQKRKSFLNGMMGKQVASSKVNIIDDARMVRGLASSNFDDEGVPTKRLEMINNGKFEHIFYDTYTALKDKTVSTGSASRASFKSVPTTGSSNFFIQPGNITKEKIISGIKNGVYVLEVMGMHMADPVSGDFSVGIAGLRIENGAVSYPVRGITLAGNMRQFLTNISEIGNDIIFYGGVGSPTIRIDDLMVGG